MYIHTQVYIYIYTYIAHLNICAYIYIYIYMCIRIHIYIHVCVCLNTCIHIHQPTCSVSDSKQVYCILDNWCICINMSCGMSGSTPRPRDSKMKLPRQRAAR